MGMAEGARSAAREALQDLGFKVEQERVQAVDRSLDFMARKGALRYAVELKAQGPYRKEQVRGVIADAILGLRRVCRKEALEPLLCVWLERASPNAMSEVQRYMQEHAHRFDWVMMDSSGWRKWKIGDERGEAVKPWLSYRGREPQLSSRASSHFSPGYQWMLKILVLAGLQKRYWGGPQERPSNISELARAAKLSPAHASNFISVFEGLGHLRRDGRRFHVVNVRQLLEDWASAARLNPGRSLPVRPVYPEASYESWLSSLIKKISKAGQVEDPRPYPGEPVLSSHEACHLLGLGRSNVRSLRLYSALPFSQILERLDLIPAEPDAAVCEVVQPRALQSVFGGHVRVGSIRVCDVLQCYLDVRQSAARGFEQAEFLFERVLSPHFEMLEWL